MDWLLLPFKSHRTERLTLNVIRQTFAGVLIDQNWLPHDFRMIFNAFRKINCISYTSIRGAILCACISGDHSAGGDANANMDLCLVQHGLLVIKAIQKIHHFDGGTNGFLTMLLAVDGRAEDCHQVHHRPFDSPSHDDR